MSNIGNKETMAKNLAKYVERSGKSQKDIAEIIGVAPSTFNEWIKGNKYPRIDKIERMANYFGILKSDLIEDKTEMTQKNDTIVRIVQRMRKDEGFLSLVESLNRLEAEKLTAIKQMLIVLK